MNSDNKKDLENLMNSMFRGGRLSTLKAEDYLDQVRGQTPKSQTPGEKVTGRETAQPEISSPELSAAQQHHEEAQTTMRQTEDAFAQLNQILAEQTAEAEKQAKDLGFSDQDLAQLQQQVRQDFGIDVDIENQQKHQPKQLQEILNAMQETAETAAIQVKGQTPFLQDLTRAFFRPFAAGIPQESVRNVFVVSGPKGSGRHSALKATVRALAEEHWLATDEILTLDGSHYSGSDQEKVFLQDLYSIIVSKSEVIVVENAEACYPPYLNQLFRLCQDEELPLSKRYVLNKGQLVEASSSLVSQAVSTLKLGGKYVVFLGTKRDSLMQNIPISLSEKIMDKPQSAPLNAETLAAIYDLELQRCVNKAETQMNLKIELDPDASARRLAVLNPSQGALSLKKDVDQLFSAIGELCLKQTEKIETLRLQAEAEWILTVGDQSTPLTDLIRVEKEDIDQIRSEMDEIVGLKEVKEVLLSMEEHYKVTQLRMKQGLKAAPVSRHMIFTGNPGTGKTTMARLVARLFKALGLLSQGQLIEVSRSDLVGRYVGHTAPLTQQVIDSALGGVLFIDEAYSLVRGKDDSFGLEAVDTLVKGMEDHREDLIVILAGYSREMEDFLKANSGLRSRFPNILEFADYTGSELTQIAQSLAKGKDYIIEEGCLTDLTIYFNTVQMEAAQRSGNGRLARNTMEKAILNQSRRILKDPEVRMDLLIREDFDLDLNTDHS